MLDKRDYELAIYSQGACNLSGLVKSLTNILPKIWEEAKAQGEGTDYVNTHPIVKLFAEQIYFLASSRDYYEALEYCKEAAK